MGHCVCMCEQLGDIQYDLTSEFSGFRGVNMCIGMILVIGWVNGTQCCVVHRRQMMPERLFGGSRIRAVLDCKALNVPSRQAFILVSFYRHAGAWIQGF